MADIIKTKESRNTSLDILTIVASFLVVLLHQAGQVESSSISAPIYIILIYIYRVLAEACVPLFVMKSGALLLACSKQIDYPYILKRVVKFALIILFWGMFYNLLCNALIGGVSLSIVRKSLVAVVTADTTYNYQFWYLYMLLGLYVMSPVIKKFTDNADKKDFVYVIAVFASIGFVLPFLCGLAGIDTQSVWVIKYLSPFSTYLLLYYILGTYLDRYPLTKRQTVALTLLAIPLGILTVLKCSSATWLSYSSPFTLIYTVLLYSLITKEKSSAWKSKISSLAKYGLGVYILHPAAIVAMRKLLGIDVNSFAPAISVPLLTIVVYVGCMFATWLLKKIPIIRRTV